MYIADENYMQLLRQHTALQKDYKVLQSLYNTKCTECGMLYSNIEELTEENIQLTADLSNISVVFAKQNVELDVTVHSAEIMHDKIDDYKANYDRVYNNYVRKRDELYTIKRANENLDKQNNKLKSINKCMYISSGISMIVIAGTLVWLLFM